MSIKTMSLDDTDMFIREELFTRSSMVIKTISGMFSVKTELNDIT